MIPRLDEIIITGNSFGNISFYDEKTGWTANWPASCKNNHFVTKGQKNVYVLNNEVCGENVLQTISKTFEIISIVLNWG